MLGVFNLTIEVMEKLNLRFLQKFSGHMPDLCTASEIWI